MHFDWRKYLNIKGLMYRKNTVFYSATYKPELDCNELDLVKKFMLICVFKNLGVATNWKKK